MAQKGSSTRDVTVGKPIVVIVKFAIPLLLLQLLSNLYSIADGKIVGEFVSIAAFTAIGSTHIIVQTFYSVTYNFASGFSIQIARRFGAGDEEGMKEVTAMIYILYSIVVAISVVIAFTLLKPLMTLLETPEAYYDLALPYLYIIFIGMPFNAFQTLFSLMLRAVGNSKIGLYIYMLSTILNVVLSLMFVGLFNWGIQGAAIGTVVCQMASCIVTFAVLKKNFRCFDCEKKHIVMEKERVTQTLSLGASMAVMTLLVNIGGLVMQYAINGLGETTIIAHTAARKIDCMMMIPITAITNGISVFIAQNLGAKQYKRIDVGIRDTLLLCIAFNVVVLLVSFLFGKSLIAWTCGYNDPEMLEVAFSYLIFNVSCFMFLATLFAYKSALIAINKSTGTLVVGIVEFIIKVYISLVMINSLGYTAIIISEPVSWFLMTIIETVFFYRAYNKLKNADLGGQLETAV